MAAYRGRSTSTVYGRIVIAPELETLDQLLGGAMPIHIIRGLFPDSDRCHRALDAMMRTGDVELLDRDGRVVPYWRFREMTADVSFWDTDSVHRLAITDKGVRRI